MSNKSESDIKTVSDFVEISTKKDKSISTLNTEHFDSFIKLLENILVKESLFESQKDVQKELVGENDFQNKIDERYDHEKLSTINSSIKNFLSAVNTYKKNGRNEKSILHGLTSLCNQVQLIINSLEPQSKELYSDKYAISVSLFPPWMFKNDVKLTVGKNNKKNLNCGLVEVPIGELNTLIWEKNNQINIKFSKELILATINLMLCHKNFENDIKAHFASVIHCQSLPEILTVPRSLTDYCKRDEPIDNLILNGYKYYEYSEGTQFERGFEALEKLIDSKDWKKLSSKFSQIADHIGRKYFGNPDKFKLGIDINSNLVKKMKNPIGSLINNFPLEESDIDDEDGKQKAKEIQEIQSGNV